MVKIDLTNILHTRAHEVLVGLFPGLFFCISVLLGNPDLASRLSANADTPLDSGNTGHLVSPSFSRLLLVPHLFW